MLVNIQDGHKCTALYWASEKDHAGCMRILLDVGRANVDGLRGDSFTTLHGAAYNGRLEVAALLIERGANINTVNDDGNTPLDMPHHDFHQNCVEMVALLKSKDAKRASELAATTSTTAAAL